MVPKTVRFRHYLLLAALLRAIFILYGDWQDSNMKVKYTDIDYQVITDGARHVLAGGSPFDRATYRYSPLIAWLACFNFWLHPLAAKAIFAFGDLLTGSLIQSILRVARFGDREAVLSSLLWLFNPFVMQLSSRGSFDTLVCALVLLMALSVLRGRYIMAGLFLGLSFHLKIYTIIYALPVYLAFRPQQQPSQSSVGKSLPRSPDQQGVPKNSIPTVASPSLFSRLMTAVGPNSRRIKFCLAFAFAFGLPTLISYCLYGWTYIQEVFIYHISRVDYRHNFSPYFYALYMGEEPTVLLSRLAFLPQLLCLLAVAFKYCANLSDLPFSLFISTFLFVTFNKVVTSQYFLWYMCLFPIMVLNIEASRFQLVCLLVGWLSAQGQWLLQAYFLEFGGLHQFWNVWLSSLIFLLTNVFIACFLIASFHSISKSKAKALHSKKSS